MTLFVAGPRHGMSTAFQDEDAPTFVDAASGSLYTLETVTFTTTDAGNRPQWTYSVRVYLHESVRNPVHACQQCGTSVDQHHRVTTGHTVVEVSPPQQVHAALQDAVMRYWFTSEGARTRARGPSVEAVAGNGGTPQPDRWYVVACLDCDPDVEVPFEDLGTRADWAREHNEATGHVMQFSEKPGGKYS